MSKNYPLSPLLRKYKFVFVFGILILVAALFLNVYLVKSPKNIKVDSGANSPGDVNGDGFVDILDFQLLSNSFGKSVGQIGYNPNANFNGDNTIDILDFQILSNNFGKTGGTGTPTPANGLHLDNAICNPDLGSAVFTNNITNQYLPFTTGYTKDHFLKDSSTGFQVRMRILPGTKTIPGTDGTDPVKALILEEFETNNGNWIETSHNWFAQTVGGSLPGTVCYFGENVFTPGSPNGNAGGSWEAGKPNARAGIMMPPNPIKGMNFLIEDAAAYGAYEDGLIQSTGVTFTTPAGTFNNVIYILEDGGNSNKRYAPGVGMISDEGALLTQY